MSKVQFGISNCYYAVRNSDGTYGVPVHMEGAQNLSVSNSGNDSNIVYADNINFWSKSAASGRSGDLQMTKFPESFYTDILGQQKETSTGMIYESPNDVSKEFALLFQLETDLGGKRVVWYRCTATAPTYTAATVTESISEASETSTITAAAATFGTGANAVTKTQGVCETGDSAYNSFFTAVVTPTVSA